MGQCRGPKYPDQQLLEFQLVFDLNCVVDRATDTRRKNEVLRFFNFSAVTPECVYLFKQVFKWQAALQ
ncbi:hypothetical protein CVM52_01260 [Pseudooceanicola lipolyticus]|uniref:Uncharacterized protein n=1 Tax=Pseudooceanicola lipolyticus TaxID=2029104 RepID=A0A2M8J6E7_9RHOB|nr:hypothetical protein CVM52_01260 [Pseudooceanicola lipolyticus]